MVAIVATDIATMAFTITSTVVVIIHQHRNFPIDRPATCQNAEPTPLAESAPRRSRALEDGRAKSPSALEHEEVPGVNPDYIITITSD